MTIAFDNHEINGWIARAIFFVQLIITCLIFKSEPKKLKKEYKQIQGNGNGNFYQKLQSVWSSTFILLSIIYCIACILIRIPRICIYFDQFHALVWAIIKINLLYYLIARLQYCFEKTQILIYGNKKKNAHSKYLFYVLYAWGICFLALCFDHCVFYAKVVILAKYGCVLAPSKPNFFIFYLWHMLVYIILDWIVLGVYIYKTLQISREFKNQTIYQNIQHILKKTLFLTVLHEAWAMAVVVIDIFGGFEMFPRDIILFLDATSTVIVFYFMMEHNSNEYRTFIRCISCTLFVDTVDTGIEENTSNNRTNISLQCVTTNTVTNTHDNENNKHNKTAINIHSTTITEV
eukprot:303426_1